MTPLEGANHGPLTGLRVLELGSIIAGPFAGRMVADMGADVVKVESPRQPDPMREWGQGRHQGRKLWWPIISRNKKLVTLDLAHEEGARLLLELVAQCDAVIENFRPGVLEKWGLGLDRLQEARPGIVLVRVSGYGQTGPYADRPGFAAAAEAMSGLRYVNGYPGQVPPRSGISLGDSLASLFAVQGLLAALYRQQRDAGSGEMVDVSILESCFALSESISAEFDVLGRVRQPSGTRLEGVAPSNVFRSRDGKLVVIAANQDMMFERLCRAIGRDDLVGDPRFGSHDERARRQDLLEVEIARWAGQHDAADIDARFAAAGVVCGPICSIEDVFANEHVRARGLLVEHDDPDVGPFLGPAVVPRFSRGSGAVRWTGPWPHGADNSEIFGERLGRSDAELADLQARGVV